MIPVECGKRTKKQRREVRERKRQGVSILGQYSGKRGNCSAFMAMGNLYGSYIDGFR